MQDTLNLMRTQRGNKTLTVYEESKGELDWNKTPITSLGTKRMMYIPGDN